MFRVQKYLHEVVGALHLCHEVLYSLSPDQGVCLSHSSECVSFRDGRRRRLCLLLQGIYNLTRDNNQLQFQLQAVLHSSDSGALAFLPIAWLVMDDELLCWCWRTVLHPSQVSTVASYSSEHSQDYRAHTLLFFLSIYSFPWKKYLLSITWSFLDQDLRQQFITIWKFKGSGGRVNFRNMHKRGRIIFL